MLTSLGEFGWEAAMIDNAIATATSGLMAAQRDLSAAASNTANAQTPSAPAGEELPEGGYEPVTVDRQAQATGGVQSDFAPADDRARAVVDAQSSGDGEVSYRANVSLTEEALRTMQAERQYTANAQVISTADDMQATLLDELG